MSRAVQGGDVGGEVPAAGGQVGAGPPGEGVQTVTSAYWSTSLTALWSSLSLIDKIITFVHLKEIFRLGT